MSSSTPANYVRSPDFPENYGDFRLISSDGVTFSFPRFLLAHVSPVFKDMLEIGTGNPMGQQAELRLAENFTTLDQLLRLLDPTKKPLPIHIDTIEGLLESAQKYQVERVFEYWEEQMKVIDEYGDSAPNDVFLARDAFRKRRIDDAGPTRAYPSTRQEPILGQSQGNNLCLRAETGAVGETDRSHP
ncbi:hypothetical protein FRC16_008597 [Serendipita sp. 398]|nr:hypothetical protein FRC16_008597 [Serendipita sp. 398]